MKVFLGVASKQASWIDRLVPLLTVDFFNPNERPPSPECLSEVVRQREACDVCLYVITPKSDILPAVAEVLDVSNTRQAKVVFVKLRDYDGARFSDDDWNAMQAVSDIVSRNRGASFDSLEDAAGFLNSFKPVDHSFGTAVIVGGSIVAWFANFDEYAQEWCRNNHFGEWLAWRALPPTIIPPTLAELEEAAAESEDLLARINSIARYPLIAPDN